MSNAAEKLKAALGAWWGGKVDLDQSDHELRAYIIEAIEELEKQDHIAQNGHPDPCTLGPLCPYCRIDDQQAEIKKLKGEIQLISAPIEAGGGVNASLRAEIERLTGENQKLKEDYWDYLANKDGSMIRDLKAELTRHQQQIEQYKKNMWGWSRGLIGEKAYTEAELRVMFGPYIESGDVTGLDPREVRLLETLVETAAENVQHQQQVAELREVLKRALKKLPHERHDYSGVGNCAGCGALLYCGDGKGREPCKPDCVLREAERIVAGEGS